MQKCYAMAARARAGLFVDQADASRSQPFERTFDVSHTVCNVVQSGATLVEKALNGGIRSGWLQQLDFPGARANKCDVDFLALDALDPGTAGLGQEFEKRKRCGDRRHRNRNMIKWKLHGLLTRFRR